MSETQSAAAIREQIAKIDKRLASGVTTVNTGGTVTTVDLGTLKEERARLERKLVTMAQPVSAIIDLSHG